MDFREFTFEPACIIRLDYVGKRVKTDQGALLGLLIGMTNLKCTELRLKEVRNDRGILGFNKCVQHAVDQWVQDIRTNQIPNVVGSYQPISSLVQIGECFFKKTYNCFVTFEENTSLNFSELRLRLCEK